MPTAAKTDAEFYERFWARVDKSGDCWEWTGYRMRTGHGQIGHRRQLLYTHRLSYELAYGPIPAGMAVCHRCDNPPCVRPNHLFLGSLSDNIKDMWTKGRQRPRTRVARLTENDVKEIRRLYANGGIAQSVLAHQFSVAQITISNVVTRKTWKDVD